MDNLTHTATGLFLSRAGLNRWTPQASAILMLAANAPDVDVVSVAGGTVSHLHYHRHLTHSLIAMPVMAILCVLLVRAVSRKPVSTPAGRVCGCYDPVPSHLALDYTNGYGIRLLLPFSQEFYRLEWTSVIDLWIWGGVSGGAGGSVPGAVGGVGNHVEHAACALPGPWLADLRTGLCDVL